MINTFLNSNNIKKTTTFSICEALSATGLRAIRYRNELDEDKIKEIVANDMDEKAVECIEQNMKNNNISDKFRICKSEATALLYSQLNTFDVIDLDPYGSAIPLLDSAMVSIKSGGLLCVTFTDMTVLCGNYPETTYYKYGSIPYKTSFCHEVFYYNIDG
jgi:tRNA (guanine26-N2/guanine27-N2)-dimethyltransferase